MPRLVELHEEIDEVNYFLKEWQRLINSQDPDAKVIAKPEIRFVAHAIGGVIDKADELQVPIVLKNGNKPIVARRPKRRHHALHDNWFIPSGSTIALTDYMQRDYKGQRVTFVGNKKGVFSLKSLAEAIAKGGKLGIAGPHAGDWSA